MRALSQQGARGGRIRLGPEIAALAEHTRHNVVETCRLILSELSQDTGETADLSVLRGDKMIFLDQVPGEHRLRAVSSVGDAFPLTTTANGQACLAELPRDEALAKADAEWARLGVAKDLGSLEARLNKVKRPGWLMISTLTRWHLGGWCRISRLVGKFVRNFRPNSIIAVRGCKGDS